MAGKRTNRRYRVVVKSRPAGTEARPGLCERYFLVLAFGVILVSVLTRTFDFSLTPPAYRGLFITRPYCGLHDWHFAAHAWASRSHVKYGLGYTKGYHTSVVGDPPPTDPQHYVRKAASNMMKKVARLRSGGSFACAQDACARTGGPACSAVFSTEKLVVEEFSTPGYNWRDQWLC